MGALYVKDTETKALAEKLAHLRGITQTAAVKLALLNELARSEPERSLHDVFAELRRTSPLRFDPDIIIDKAFYDSLNDEEDD